MPRNGSGVCTPDVDFTVEAASPPIEIAALDQALDDIADEITNSIAADGQTNPSADLKMNGFKHTNVGAATALTHYARVSELIDQDHIYYVDSGSANTLAITPSPAIAAYEEGQRFVVRAAANNSGASTLNVNGIGAFAIQTPDGAALSSGAIVLGGIYEFTYDANTTPDRWVMTSPASKVPDAMLSANVPLLNAANTFTRSANSTSAQTIINSSSGTSATAAVTISNNAEGLSAVVTGASYSGAFLTNGPTGAAAHVYSTAIPLVIGTGAATALVISTSQNFDFKAGTVTTTNTSASEVGYKGAPSRNVTSSTSTAATDAGGTIRFTSGSGQTFTLDSDPPLDSIVALRNTSGSDWTIAASGTLTLAGAGTGSRTLATTGMASAQHDGSGNWCISGAGLS